MVLLGLVLGVVLGGFIVFSLRGGGTVTLAKTETVYVTITHTVVENSRRLGCIVFSTTNDAYRVSEPVELVLVNNCESPITLPNSAPWKIVGPDGRVVFTPVSLQVLVEVKPGERMRWVWDQRDAEGREVPAGRYNIVIEILDKGSFKTSFTVG
jgi:plastocyanin